MSETPTESQSPSIQETDARAKPTSFASDQYVTEGLQDPIKGSHPAPHSLEELELLVHFAHAVPLFPGMSLPEQDSLLRQLEAYECHAQVVELLNWRLENGRLENGRLEKSALEKTDPAKINLAPSQTLADFLWLMRVQYLGLERFDEFVETAKNCISQLHVGFVAVRIQMVEDILGSENFAEQHHFYRHIVDSFADNSQKVLLLERLSLLFEKKLFLENEVEPVFRRIIELDPLNVKALRFYKLWFVQSMRWKDAAEQLERLIEASSNPHEKQRAAHELAQLYLYNLNQPQQARDILVETCSNSVLDTKQTLVDALERLNLTDELLTCLKEAEVSAKDAAELSAIKLKQGLVCMKANRGLEAVGYLRESIIHHPHQMLAYEALISALLGAEKAEDVLRVLEDLRKVVLLPASQKTLDDAIARGSKLQPLLMGP